MKHDYTKLDSLMLARIAIQPPVKFTVLCHNRAVSAESARIADEGNAGKPARLHTPQWRIVDRRLQALRKAGRIAYQRKPEGWLPADPVLAGQTSKGQP